MMRAKPPTRTRPLRSGKVSSKTPPIEKKGTNIETEKPDISVLRRPIDTSVHGMNEVVKLFQTGTKEICEILSNECSIIYECKICRNLFRSVANFLSHKRSYCSSKFNDLKKSTANNDQVSEKVYLVGCGKSNTISTRTTTRKDIVSLLDNIFERETKIDRNGKGSDKASIVLKEIKSTSAGLYKYNKENLEENGYEKEIYPTLGPDGRLVENGESVEDAKTVSPPVQISRTCFVCPCCKKYFPNTWSIHRHLYKVHRKTSEQVRKLRPLIQKKQVSAEDIARSKNPPAKTVEEKPYDQDRAWMEELEGNMELQRCLGCGRKFERRVALLSHSASCQKRITVIQKRRPSPPKLEADKRTGIQVRMYYEKVQQQGGKQQASDPSSLSLPLKPILTSTCLPSSPSSSIASPSLSSPQLSDKDITDVVSRYRKDLEVHDKCRRLEAKLLQLHKVAVEEVEGSLNECLISVSQSSIQECIGTIAESHPSVCDSSLDIDTDNIKTEQIQVPPTEDASPSEHTCACADPDIIVIDDEEDEENAQDQMEEADQVSYINGDANKDQLTEETDVTSTVSIHNNGYNYPIMNGEIRSVASSDSTAPEYDEELDTLFKIAIGKFIDRKSKKCLKCQKVFPKFSYVKRHVATSHFNIYKFKCLVKKCCFKCYLWTDIQKHLLKFHRKNSGLGLTQCYERLPLDRRILRLILKSDKKRRFSIALSDLTEAESMDTSVNGLSESSCDEPASKRLNFDNSEKSTLVSNIGSLRNIPECNSEAVTRDNFGLKLHFKYGPGVEEKKEKDMEPIKTNVLVEASHSLDTRQVAENESTDVSSEDTASGEYSQDDHGHGSQNGYAKSEEMEFKENEGSEDSLKSLVMEVLFGTNNPLLKGEVFVNKDEDSTSDEDELVDAWEQ